MKLVNLTYILILTICLFGQAHASVKSFKKYLDYHNQSETNSTKIKFNTWYRLSDLIKTGNDVSKLLTTADEENINLIVETVGKTYISSFRYLIDAQTFLSYDDVRLRINHTNGFKFKENLENGEYYTAASDHSVSLKIPNDDLDDLMIMILDSKVTEETTLELLSNIPKPKWK
jgi:hypothetical protein